MKIGILQQHNTADVADNKTRLAQGIIDLAHRGAARRNHQGDKIQ